MCKSEPKKVLTGVYGGSFNPIHEGHVFMAGEILRLGLVDEMWLVVSPQNPLKSGGLWDDDFRLNLARVAVRDIPGVEVSDVEFSLPKPNYMLTTLETLSARHPDREFVLVIGMDNWDCFHRWHRWEDILRRYRVIVLPRRREPLQAEGEGRYLPPEARVCFADVSLIDISSTWIRNEITDNPSYGGQGLPAEVWEMIRYKMR